MNQEELKQQIVKLEAEIAALKEVKSLVSARTSLALMGMASSAARHSIVQKAAAIRNNVAILRRSIKAGTDPQKIDSILENIDRIAELIAEFPAPPSLSSEESVHIIHLNEILQERIQQIQHRNLFSDIEIELQLDSGEHLLVRANPAWLVRGLDLLLENSAEAMANAKIKRLLVKTFICDKQACILIEDTGRGIPPEVRPLLFIQPIQKKKGEKGSGIGLLMAQMIFQAFGGGVKLERTNAKGSAFIIFFPREE
jgi:C4-dicarboxylate-specific signal transduction histidine kinase